VITACGWTTRTPVVKVKPSALAVAVPVLEDAVAEPEYKPFEASVPPGVPVMDQLVTFNVIRGFPTTPPSMAVNLNLTFSPTKILVGSMIVVVPSR
jgi:hypothetical protein